MTTLGLTYYQEKQGKIANLKARLSFKREVVRITSKHGIEGFTLLSAMGAWQGKTEPSFQLQLVGVPQSKVRALARDFRDRFKQDAVMVSHNNKTEFI